MKWFNVEISSLHAPEYIGSDPVHRATWLNLSAYCCEQENGGRIANCRDWKSRMWEQLCGVTLDEVSASSRLWSWEGQDLIVWRYPIDREVEIQAKRSGAKAGGLAKAAKYGRERNRKGIGIGKEGYGTPDGSAISTATGNAIGTKAENGHYHAHARTALWFLNDSAGKHFRETDANLTVISARLSEPGVELCCVKKMIERQCRKWKGTNMEDFLRPETLFGKQKFDGYYASRDAPIIEGKPDPKLNPIDPLFERLEQIEQKYGNPGEA